MVRAAEREEAATEETAEPAAITGETAEPAAAESEAAIREETVETTATVPEETTIPAVTERATADQAVQAGKAAVPEQAVNRMAAIPVKIPIKTELPERILQETAETMRMPEPARREAGKKMRQERAERTAKCFSLPD